MSADTLLSRLTKVRRTGSGRWVACCPAHDDRSPSLAIRELPDGRILLHDFGGCEFAEILRAAGVAIDELFPTSLPIPGKGDARHFTRQRLPFSPLDALICIAHEAKIAMVAAGDLSRNEALSDADRARLVIACNRIEAALTYTNV